MLAFSIDYYGIFFWATQSVELFCTYYVDTLYTEIDEIMPDTQYVLSMIIADGNKAYINEDLVKFTKVTGDGERKQIVVTTLSNISKTNARLYEKGKGWRILKNDASNTVVSDVKDVQLELGSVATLYEPYREQVVTLPYTLNAIPVSSGGNVTIDGQQYIADYVDVERGKIVKMVDSIEITGGENWNLGFSTWKTYPHCAKCDNINANIKTGNCLCEEYSTYNMRSNNDVNSASALYDRNLTFSNERFSTAEEFKTEFKRLYNSGTPIIVYYIMNTPIETDLTAEEIATIKASVAYYPVTNVSVNSDQLDGYTVFNYPISMANGWNYVKQQLSDNRDYIYNMDAKTQDIDMQSTEAYVNSEYAVALTELEAM